MTGKSTRAGQGGQDQARTPWTLIDQTYWMVTKLWGRRFYHLGISDSQARLLLALSQAGGPIKPSTVATLLFQETQNITGILHRIEGRGWVRRLPDPNDRRAVGIELTDKGREIVEQIEKVSAGLYNELFAAALTSAQGEQLVELLKAVRAQGFKLPETDFKLRRAQQHPIWKD